MLIPWTDFWERNYFVEWSRLSEALLTSNYLRGALSGLGLVNIAALKSLASFLAIIGASELLDDERFATTDARRTNRNAFDAACEARLTTHPVDVWVERFNAAGIPAGPVYRVDETFADPQVQHLGITAQVVVPGGDTATVLRYPVTLDRTPATVRSGPPAPGTHTLEVLRELGYDDDTVDRLVRDGAVSTDTTPGINWLA